MTFFLLLQKHICDAEIIDAVIKCWWDNSERVLKFNNNNSQKKDVGSHKAKIYFNT